MSAFLIFLLEELNMIFINKLTGGTLMKLWRLTLSAVAVFVCLLTFASHQAFAQGSGNAFYMEVLKDGRIYVFNKPEVYEAWAQSGEIGISITRIGYGPNGETMVFDSEEAIHLYNFKHDRPAEVIIKAPEKKPPMEITWKDGKTTFKLEKFEMNLSNRIQFRYTYEDPAILLVPPSQVGDSRGSFRIRRAKTKFDGWIYTKNLTYELQLNWADILSVLEDANLNYDFTNGKKSFMVKGGQFKVPFGRQELTSSGSQEFVDRALVTNEFARGRDQGVQVWGQPFGGKLDWRAGIFNGNRRNAIANDNNTYQYDARLSWQPFGDVKYSEGDFDSTDKPLIAVETEYEHDELLLDQLVFLQRERSVWGADFVLKYKGLFVYIQAWPYREITPIAADGTKGTSFQAPGYLYQAGYFIVPQKLEVAARYGDSDQNKDISDDRITEIRGAVSYYFNKHNLKLQADYGQLETQSRDLKVDEFRIQLQFIF